MNPVTTIAFIVSALVLTAGVSRADEVKIGTIDMQKAIQSSETGKKAKGELEQAFTKRKKNFKLKKQTLKNFKKSFKRNKQL